MLISKAIPQTLSNHPIASTVRPHIQDQPPPPLDMPYIMDLYADGVCRRNSEAGPIAAAAVVMTNKYGHSTTWTHRLPSTPTPTSQRAQLCAIILALERAQTKAQQMRSGPNMDIIIITSSKYAVGCMTQWCWKWMRNGFRNQRGREISNRDLIEKALVLEGEVLGAGTVEWRWVPRAQNGEAEDVVNGVLDEMEPGYEASDSDAPIWGSRKRGRW